MHGYLLFVFVIFSGHYLTLAYYNEEKAIYDETTPDYKPHPKSGAFLIDDIDIDIGRNAVPGSERLWTNGIVPYIIDKAYPDVVKARIHEAMREIENDVNTPGSSDCIKFKHRTNEKHYVYILARESGCHSKVGVTFGGKHNYQEISIGRGCERKGIIMHELTHALGFWHEHDRPDRDNYVKVNWKNIKSGKERNFWVQVSAKVLNTSYDYSSIMHYSTHSFAKDRNIPVLTLKKKAPIGIPIGQRLQYSKNDVRKIQRLYSCKENTNHVKQAYILYLEDCDFTGGLCSFTQDKTDDVDWKFRHGGVSAKRAKNQLMSRARLMTPFFYVQSLCLTYSFMIPGKNSQITVYIKSKGGHSIKQRSYEGRSDRRWHTVISHMSFRQDFNEFPYQLIFEATVGGSSVYLDDVKIREGKCD